MANVQRAGAARGGGALLVNPALPTGTMRTEGGSVYVPLSQAAMSTMLSDVGVGADAASHSSSSGSPDGARGAVHVGDRVSVLVHQVPHNATVKFVGRTRSSHYRWVGVAFDEPVGRHGGSVEGVRYFEAAEGHGAFVRPEEVIPLGGSSAQEGQDGAGVRSPRGAEMALPEQLLLLGGARPHEMAWLPLSPPGGARHGGPGATSPKAGEFATTTQRGERGIKGGSTRSETGADGSETGVAKADGGEVSETDDRGGAKPAGLGGSK
eukprot:TRINITY_DN18147_c0_g1_i1.p1 TRINITY_DN18147_c0_g1~~TRINITY_DN18147_c0_g1_i1.p1  ORF type:complete len:266 (+),score=49.12 TRINITY_DN18147_c0_g1_i1:82-879(+)